MKKFALLLPVLVLSCAASMAAVTTTTTTTNTTTTTSHKSRLVYTGPTLVTIHTHPKKRPVRHTRVASAPARPAAAPNTRQLGAPPAPGTTVTTTTTVQKRSGAY